MKRTMREVRYLSRTSSSYDTARRVAVLYQAIDPPIINGVRKPKKPGGAFCFQLHVKWKTDMA
jgi:hypothetical protein